MRAMSEEIILGGALGAAAAVGLCAAGLAAAQTRPALVRNVDEPGRNPYQSFISFNEAAPSSDNSYFCQHSPDPPVCFLQFPAVPAGKRLVIENLTGVINVAVPSFPCSVNIQTTVPSFANLVTIPTQLLAGDLGSVNASVFQYGANASLKLYLEPGATPRVQVSVCDQPGSLRNGRITISGYLVDLP